MGGPTVYARHLVSGLRRLDTAYDVNVVTPGGTFGRLTRPAFTPWGRGWVALEAMRTGARLVHGLHIEAPPGRVPAIVTVQDVVPVDFPASLPNRLARSVYRRVLVRSLQRARRVIVPSPLTAERLLALGADATRLEVIPLGVGSVFRPSTPPERDEARRRFAGGRRYVVASTGTRPHKNLEGLSRAAVQLGGDVVVVAAGRGPGHDVPGVRFVGELDDDALRAFYGGAEVMVLPALVEGFGLPAAEALACGVPVICGPHTGALAHIRPGALEVDVARPPELADAIRSVVDDEALRARLAAGGRAAVAPLTVDAMAVQTAAVYDRVLGCE